MVRDFPLGSRSVAALSRPAGTGQAGPPVELAATVMLLRDEGAAEVAGRSGAATGSDRSAGPGVEVFTMRRVPGMAFAPRMTVFPGGRVDRSDFSPEVPEHAGWGERLGMAEPLARAAVVAAVREVFEECGVLLAGPTDVELVADVTTPAWRAERVALLSRSTSLPRVLEEHGLVLRDDLLVPRARWVTPEFETRRYDTVFFAAALPDGQDADDKSSESDAAGWVTPAAVLAAFAAGEVMLLPPTIVALESLAAATSPSAPLVADGDLRPVLPVLADTPAGPVVRVVFPG